MKHQGTKIIETSRLILRKLTLGDASAMYRNWLSDPKVTEFLRWPTYTDPAQVTPILKEWIDSYSNPNFYHWGIIFKEIGEPIGTIGAVGINERVESVHIGYCIGSPWWHKGIMTEALGALIPFFFEKVEVNRIESQHDPMNPNSGKVMTNCGLRYEGTLRQADFSNRGIVDAAVYGMIKSDYFEQFKQNKN